MALRFEGLWWCCGGGVRPALLEATKPLIPVLLPTIEQHGQILNGELRDKVLTISAATMDRALSQVSLVRG
ncbi:hypothetical protein LCM4576_33080 [Mesorhizobium sp. LCM 4576]|nr:hypothetical protein LCM4576_33080 [Mesorhizobium sp. LCM 4576]